jgi:hypothetical protein
VWRESIEPTRKLKSLLFDTAKRLKGSARRHFMARTVKALGPGGASQVEREFGWNRKTIRPLAEELLPNSLDDIRAIVDGQSQTDPQFKNSHLYTRLSAPEQDVSLFDVCTSRMRLNQVASIAAKMCTKLLPDCHYQASFARQ